jgi:hypothetical protein
MIYELLVKGLKSTHSLEEALKTKINNILEIAPSDASASAELRKVKKGYEGVLNIFSSQGKFIAQAVGDNLNDLVHNLSHQINKQIKDWRVCRFQN